MDYWVPGYAQMRIVPSKFIPFLKRSKSLASSSLVETVGRWDLHQVRRKPTVKWLKPLLSFNSVEFSEWTWDPPTIVFSLANGNEVP